MNTKGRILAIGMATTLLFIGMGMLIIPSGVDATYTGTVTINADGSVTPSGAPVDHKGKNYKLTDDINGMLVVKRSNVDLNGKGYSITGDGTDYGIHLDNVDKVSMKNFYVYDAYVGIRMDTCCKCTIKDNTLTDSVNAGIALWDDSDGNTIKGNYATGNQVGIALLYYSSENVVKDNMIISNRWYGLDTYYSDNNMFKDNTVKYQPGWGITFRFSADNVAKDNYIDGGNYYGISIYYGSGGHTVKDNIIKNIGFSGIYLDSETDIMVCGNEIYDSYIGIGSWFTDDITIKYNFVTGSTVPAVYLDTCTGNYVHKNELTESGFGVYFWNSYEDLVMDNVITYNLIEDNGYGIYTDDFTVGSDIAYDCGGNTLHHNNIIDNSVQVYEGFDNIWDDGKGEGNYWSDYAGSDTDGDGVGDTSLPHQGVDYYPLMESV